MIQSLESNNIFHNCKKDARDKLGLDNTESNLKIDKVKKRNSNAIYASDYFSSKLFIIIIKSIYNIKSLFSDFTFHIRNTYRLIL